MLGPRRSRGGRSLGGRALRPQHELPSDGRSLVNHGKQSIGDLVDEARVLARAQPRLPVRGGHPPVGVGLLLDRVGGRRLGRSQLAFDQGTLLPGRSQFGLEPGVLPTRDLRRFLRLEEGRSLLGGLPFQGNRLGPGGRGANRQGPHRRPCQRSLAVWVIA